MSCDRLAPATALPVLRDWLLNMSRSGSVSDYGAVPDHLLKRGLNRFDGDGWFLKDQTELEVLTGWTIETWTHGQVSE